ncbi:MAG TPA: amidase family protein [Rhizomicrobium sp.]|nr:amidase family protein [Rhizomicrobium sp.]
MVDTYATARSMLADLAAKKISARELLEAHVARNGQIAKAVNAVIATDLARARKDAAAIDDARARGAALGALAGLPITIKDGFDVENMPAVSGNPALANGPKDCADAAVVASARKQGAVIWGKTNVPFMLSDIQSYNAIHGTTNNPYDTSKVPGGSSGGAAAALATGVTPLEIGSDIGGSLRHPANFCGVTALKTTWGSLDGRGHVPPSPGRYLEVDLGVYGPMARNVDDLKLLWSVLRGTPEQKRRDIKGGRVAVWNEEPGWPLAREVRVATERAAKALGEAGATVEFTKPDISGAELFDAYTTILTPIVAFDFPEELIATFAAMRDTDRVLMNSGGPEAGMARFRYRASTPYREIVAAQIVRQRLKDRLADFFTRYDAIVMPIDMVPPFAHLQEGSFADRMLPVDNEMKPYNDLLDWISVGSALHVPALAVQAGQTAEGLPVGVQIVGPWHGEDRLFDYAFAVEERLGGFKRPPI